MVKLSMYNEMTTVCELESVNAQPMKSHDYRQKTNYVVWTRSILINIDCGVSRSVIRLNL